MKKNKKSLGVLLLAAAMSIVMAGCGNKDAGTPAVTKTTVETGMPTETKAPAGSTEAVKGTEAAEATKGAEATKEIEATKETGETKASEASEAATSAPAAEGALALNYDAEPDAYVGNWVLANAYAADKGMLKVAPDACHMKIETSIDTNKLVDEAAYIHADATNLKGTMSFKHAGIDVDDYSCSGNWSDWTVVDIKGENEAYFKGAIKFKIRDDDNGVFFDVLTGDKIKDMELFNVLGMNADGQLILGYSQGHIERDSGAKWEYAYIFDKAK